MRLQDLFDGKQADARPYGRASLEAHLQAKSLEELWDTYGSLLSGMTNICKDMHEDALEWSDEFRGDRK